MEQDLYYIEIQQIRENKSIAYEYIVKDVKNNDVLSTFLFKDCTPSIQILRQIARLHPKYVFAFGKHFHYDNDTIEEILLKTF